ncbi:MAG: MarR family winged helix-turn-helix transcriptional regulator [Deltaproteobacteria bacterium]
MADSTLPALPCACANIRRAARAVTQLYDRELRGTGLGVTQFTLLQVLSRTGELSQGRLGDGLSMDSTTLTRTLANLRREGWIAVRTGTDRRERLVSLTAAGRRQLKLSYPQWERAQERLRKILGDQRWEELGDLTHRVVRSAREA